MKTKQTKRIAIDSILIPSEYKDDSGFINKDVEVILVFVEGTKKQKKEKLAKIQKYCKLLKQVII